MRIIWILIIFSLFLNLFFYPALATPSKDYYSCKVSYPCEEWTCEEWGRCDDWDVCRTCSFVVDGKGFFGFIHDEEIEMSIPIVYESLGKNADIASEGGKYFKEKYPDKYYRAEKIFLFVRDGVIYENDEILFGYEEFAQNADELLYRMANKSGYGDCEDQAILLGILYKSAGYRTAIIIVPDHAATLVFLPNYRKANYVWTHKNERGRIWAEATGRTNYLGWTPEDLIDGPYIIEEIVVPTPTPKPTPTPNATPTPTIPPIPMPPMPTSPGFEAVFALACLSAVAYLLVLIRRGK